MDGLLDGFAGQNSKIDPSDLTSDDVGVSRAGNLATGPLAVTEVAQLSTIDNPALQALIETYGEPIGVISEMTGEVIAIQTDDVERVLSIGSPIFQNDEVETFEAGAATITFADETTYSLGPDSAMLVDQYIYDPATNEGEHKFSALKGVFVFVSGLVADDAPENVSINTPAGTLGIRGTVIAGSIEVEQVTDGMQFTFVQGQGFLESGLGDIVDLVGQFASVQVTAEGAQTFTLDAEGLQRFANIIGEGGVRVLETAAPEVDWATILTTTAQDEDEGEETGDDQNDDQTDDGGDTGGDGDGTTNRQFQNDGEPEEPSDGSGEDTTSGGAGEDRLSTRSGSGSRQTSSTTNRSNNDDDDDDDQIITIIGGDDDDDTLDGGEDNDTIVGGDDNDTIDGGDGNDTIIGGDDNDTIIGDGGNGGGSSGGGGDPEADPVDPLPTRASLLDRGIGSFGNDAITGTADDAGTLGLDGDDTINSGSDGADYGGLGADLIYASNAEDTFSGTAAELDNDTIHDFDITEDTIFIQDYDPSGDAIDISEVGGGEYVIETTVGGSPYEIHLTGLPTGKTYTVTGDPTESTLFDVTPTYAYGLGDNSIFGSGGNDALFGHDGNDTINGSIGKDYILGGEGADSIDGSNGHDYVDGGEGHDTLLGGSDNGSDTLLGAAGDDSIDGGDGDDLLQGGKGHDRIDGDIGNDTIIGGDGIDTLFGGMGHDYIDGNDSSADELYGGDGDDTIVASYLDTVYGGAGANTINLEGTQVSIYGTVAELHNNTIDDFDFGLDKLYITDATTVDVSSIYGNTVTLNIDSGASTLTLYSYQGVSDLTASISGGEVTFETASGTAIPTYDYIDAGDYDTILANFGLDSIHGTLSGFDGVTIDNAADDYFPLYFDSVDFSLTDTVITVTNVSGVSTVKIDTNNDGSAESEFDINSYKPLFVVDFYWDSELGGSYLYLSTDLADASDANVIYGDDGNSTPAADNLVGTSGIDVIYAGSLSDVVYGNGGSDLIYGDGLLGYGGVGENDTLYGQDGDDTLYGTTNGADVLSGGAGNDLLYGGGSNDTLAGGEGRDTLNGQSGDDDLFGGGGDDNLRGGGGDNWYEGGAGNDYIVADGDNDTVQGGTGNDYISVSSSMSAIILGDAGDDYIVVSDYISASTKTVLSGGEGDDTIYGGGGNDIIYGEDGANVIHDGAGDDRIYLGGDAETIVLGAGADTLIGYAEDFANDTIKGFDFTEDVLIITDASGSPTFDNTNFSSDMLTVLLSTGEEFYLDHAPNLGNGENATNIGISFTLEEDTGGGSFLVGDETAENLSGSADDDTIHGNDDNDTISGLAGDDYLSGGADQDHIYGGDGADTIFSGIGNDLVYGGTDNDFIMDQKGYDNLYGGSGDDTLIGGEFNDGLYGEVGDDIMLLVANSSNASGGSGNDTFVVAGDPDASVSYDLADYNASEDTLFIVPGFDTTDVGSISYTIDASSSSSTILFDMDGDGTTDVEVELFGIGITGPVTLTPGNIDFGIDSLDGATVTFSSMPLTTSGSTASEYVLPYSTSSVSGDDGNDLIDGGDMSAAPTIEGGMGADTIFGSGNADIIYGSSYTLVEDGSADVVYGDDGNDTIYGGSGDVLYGDEGDDRCVIEMSTPGGSVELVDFAHDYGGEMDSLQLLGSNIVYVNAIQNIVAGTTTLNFTYDVMHSFEIVFSGGIFTSVLPASVPSGTVFDVSSNTSPLIGTVTTGPDTVTGHIGNDSFGGNDGDDLLYGGPGDDVVRGNNGNDTVYGGFGDDTVRGQLGDDVLYGDDGDDRLRGEDGADTLYGGDGDDVVLGDDSIDFAEPADLLYGQAGDDLIYGFDGTDTIYGGVGRDSIYGGYQDDLIFGNEDDDVIYGGSGDDSLHGGKGLDVLYGGSGADTLSGGAGADTLYGGSGNGEIDVFYIDNATNADGDELYDFEVGASEDFIRFGGALSGMSAANISLNGGAMTAMLMIDSDLDGEFDATITIFGDDIIDGYSFSGDDLYLSSAKQTSGFGSNDTDDLTGTSGADNFTGLGENQDTVSAGAGDDSLYGGLGDDSLDGGADNDIIMGDDGRDHLAGGTGDDSITGDAGNDTINGNDGNDTIDGGDGDDLIYVNSGASGTDSVLGGNGDDVIQVQSGAGTVDDTIIAGSGDDEIILQTNDIGATASLEGGADMDTLVLDASGMEFNFSDVDSYTENFFGAINGFERIEIGSSTTASLDVGDVVDISGNNELEITLDSGTSTLVLDSDFEDAGRDVFRDGGIFHEYVDDIDSPSTYLYVNNDAGGTIQFGAVAMT